MAALGARGSSNVVEPSNEEVIGRFTAWQERAQLAIVEELFTGARSEVVNRLKTVITEPVLRIEEKHRTAYAIPNFLNLLCFTNHRDAVALENGDRRWLVVFSPARPLEDSYYEGLFTNIYSDEAAAAVKHFLLTHTVSMNPKGRAPDTVAKTDMRRLSMSEVEANLLDLFDEGAPPFDFDLLRLEDLMARRWTLHFTRCSGAPLNGR